MVQKPESGIRHLQGFISVGFLGHIYLQPKDVSFAGAQFREGGSQPPHAVASGIWANENGNPHPVNNWVDILPGNSLTGSRVNGDDPIAAADKAPPFSEGDFVWNILWQYRVGIGAEKNFDVAQHHHWADPAPHLGRAHISKKGVGPFTKDAAEDYSGW